MPYRNQIMNIFILEDSETDRELYKRHLKNSQNPKFTVTEAETFRQAKLLLEKNPRFDCYLVDYQLPDIDGISFTREVLSRQSGHFVPAVVMVTGHGSEEIAVEALKLGVTDYLTKKSISEGYLVQPLIGAIERSRLRSEVSRFRADLERSNRELTDFAHTASHDLKAPLRRIASYCEILTEDAAPRLTPEDKANLGRIHANAARMQALIDGLLAYARVTTEQEEWQPVELSAVAAEILEDVKADPNTGEASFTVSALPRVQGYPLKIQQVLTNLVSNAVKYRSARPLEVSISADGADGDMVKISVRDNGMGIAPEYHEEIFRDFRRLHAQKEIEGTGLGLSICRKIVELHGGKIWVESKPGEGACFYFTLKKAS